MIAESISDVLDPLINLLITRQTKVGPNSSEMTAYAWLKDVCTIRVGGPRGSGHSTAWRDLVRKYSGPRFLVVNRVKADAEVNKSLMRESRNLQIVCCDDKNWIKGITVNFNAVVFDCNGGDIPKEKLEEMYHLCAAFIETGERFFFIILG